MSFVAYRYYRISITDTSVSSYWRINQIQMFSSNDGTGTNLATGGGVTASASSTYSVHAASRAIDADLATFWSANPGSGAWFQVDLGSAAVIRSLRIWSDSSGGYHNITQFDLLGSNDGTTFTLVVPQRSFNLTGANLTNFLVRFGYFVSGTSVLDDASPASAVFLLAWSSGALISKLTPDGSGDWGLRLPSDDVILAVHTGPSGYRPLADGPITPGAG